MTTLACPAAEAREGRCPTPDLRSTQVVTLLPTDTPTTGETTPATIIAAVFGFLFLVTLLALVAVYWRQRRPAQVSKKPPPGPLRLPSWHRRSLSDSVRRRDMPFLGTTPDTPSLPAPPLSAYLSPPSPCLIMTPMSPYPVWVDAPTAETGDVPPSPPAYTPSPQ